MNDLSSQNNLRVSQNYFSALARGGLAAAVSHSANSSHSPRGRQGSIGKSTNTNQFFLIQPQMINENINLNNMQQSYNNQMFTKSNQESNDKSINQQESQNKHYGLELNGQSMMKINKQLFPVESNRDANIVSQQQILNQKRLQSLMSGNDLQPLEEEISKEDDDSIIVRVEIEKSPQNILKITNPNSARQSQSSMNTNSTNRQSQKQSRHRKKSSNKSNPYFPQTQNSKNIHGIKPATQLQNNNQSNKQSTESLKQHLSQDLLDHVGIMSNGTSTQSLLKGSTLKSCSSYVSGDFNYNSQMEEALMLEQLKLSEYENNSAPKIFDPQFQQSYEHSTNQKFNVQVVNQNSGQTTLDNTYSANNSQNQSKDLTQNQNLQQTVMDFNQMQKEKARLIIESLKAQQNKQNSNHSHSSSQTKVEKRLFDYQKKLEEKIESQRKLKGQQELQQLRPVPQISGKSNEILMRKSLMMSQNNINPQQSIMHQQFSPKSENTSPGRSQLQQPQGNNMFAQPLDKSGYQTQQIYFQNYQVEQKAYYEELQRKEDQRIKILQEKEMKGFTGKPQINKKSQSIKRKVDDLIEWKDVQEKKRQEEFKKKVQQESDELQQMQSHRVVNKNSEKIVETRFRGQRSNEKVEDRLLRDASLRKKKIEKQSQQKQIFYIDDLNNKKNNNKGGQGLRGRSRSQNHKNDNLKKSRNQTPTNQSQNAQQSEHIYTKPIDSQRFKFDQRIFSQSVDCPNNYYGQTSPNQSNNYMASQTSNNLQSPYEQSNRSILSTNLNNFQHSQLVNPQSDFSQIQNYNSAINQTYVTQQQQLGMFPQQNQHTGGGSFDLNQFHFNNPMINAFSPQRLYSQQIQTQQYQRQGFPVQNMSQQNPMFQQHQHQIGNNSQQYPVQQVSYMDNSQTFPSLMMNSQLAQNQNNISQKIQMTSQLQDLSGLTPNQGSFVNQNNLINNLTLQQIPINDKHISSIRPYVQQQPLQQKQQQHKKSSGYVSLFDKVQKMNASQHSQNSDLESCNSQQSQQSLPIVSAQMPQIFNQIMQPNQDMQTIMQQQQPRESQQNYSNHNSIYQQIQQDSLKLKEYLVNPQQQINQQQVQSQNSQPNLSTINCVDPSSLITYPVQVTQENIGYQTISAPIPENIHQQLLQYALPQNHYLQNQYYSGQNMLIQQNQSNLTSQNLQYINSQSNTQDQIIHKILDNSFIPSGNVNQTRRTSSRGTQENEGTLGYSQTLQWHNQLSSRQDQINEDLHDVFAENDDNDNFPLNLQQQQDNNQYYSQRAPIAQNAFNYNNTNNNHTVRTRLTNDNGQILETDFIITNTSRDSDLVVRNLTQVLGNDVQSQQKQQKNLRSQSESGRGFGSQKSSVSPNKQNDFASLKGSNFMERNNQWLENKKYRLERAQKEKEQQEDRQCPFKPQIQIHQVQSDKFNNFNGSSSCRSRSQARGSSVSIERGKSLTNSQKIDILSKRSSQDKQPTVTCIDNNIQIQDNCSNELTCFNDLTNQPSAIRKTDNYDEMSTSMKQYELLNSSNKARVSNKNTKGAANITHLGYSQVQGTNLDKKRNMLINDQLINDNNKDMDISGQCDITSLSPEPQIRGNPNNNNLIDDSNFETSFQSSHGQAAQNINVLQPSKGIGQVIGMTKRNIIF